MRNVTVYSPNRLRQVTTLNPKSSQVGQVQQQRSQTRRVITVGIPGPSGNNPFINSNVGFDYTQTNISGIWTIVHNLGYRPAAQAFSPGGMKIDTKITHLSLNTIQLELNPPSAGYARLS